jgi:hypothetical protein
MHCPTLLLRGWLIAAFCLTSRVLAAELSFEERVAAEREIQRVYYRSDSHSSGLLSLAQSRRGAINPIRMWCSDDRV